MEGAHDETLGHDLSREKKQRTRPKITVLQGGIKEKAWWKGGCIVKEQAQLGVEKGNRFKS